MERDTSSVTCFRSRGAASSRSRRSRTRSCISSWRRRIIGVTRSPRHRESASRRVDSQWALPGSQCHGRHRWTRKARDSVRERGLCGVSCPVTRPTDAFRASSRRGPQSPVRLHRRRAGERCLLSMGARPTERHRAHSWRAPPLRSIHTRRTRNPASVPSADRARGKPRSAIHVLRKRRAVAAQ